MVILAGLPDVSEGQSSSQNLAGACASVISAFFLKQSRRAVHGILSPSYDHTFFLRKYHNLFLENHSLETWMLVDKLVEFTELSSRYQPASSSELIPV